MPRKASQPRPYERAAGERPPSKGSRPIQPRARCVENRWRSGGAVTARRACPRRAGARLTRDENARKALAAQTAAGNDPRRSREVSQAQRSRRLTVIAVIAALRASMRASATKRGSNARLCRSSTRSRLSRSARRRGYRLRRARASGLGSRPTPAALGGSTRACRGLATAIKAQC